MAALSPPHWIAPRFCGMRVNLIRSSASPRSIAPPCFASRDQKSSRSPIPPRATCYGRSCSSPNFNSFADHEPPPFSPDSVRRHTRCRRTAPRFCGRKKNARDGGQCDPALDEIMMMTKKKMMMMKKLCHHKHNQLVQLLQMY